MVTKIKLKVTYSKLQQTKLISISKQFDQFNWIKKKIIIILGMPVLHEQHNSLLKNLTMYLQCCNTLLEDSQDLKVLKIWLKYVKTELVLYNNTENQFTIKDECLQSHEFKLKLTILFRNILQCYFVSWLVATANWIGCNMCRDYNIKHDAWLSSLITKSCLFTRLFCCTTCPRKSGAPQKIILTNMVVYKKLL